MIQSDTRQTLGSLESGDWVYAVFRRGMWGSERFDARAQGVAKPTRSAADPVGGTPVALRGREQRRLLLSKVRYEVSSESLVDRGAEQGARVCTGAGGGAYLKPVSA